MYEVLQIRQIPGEARRRWFCSDEFDLILWYADEQNISGFELSYNKQRGEHAIIWQQLTGFQHMAVDDGEERAGKYKSTPMLLADGFFDAPRIRQLFQEQSKALPPEVAELLLEKLAQHPNFKG